MFTIMLAAYAARTDAADPLSALEVDQLDLPSAPDGWVRVHVRAAALNHHDLWSLRGVGLSDDALPMVLGCDAAGTTDDGTEVIVYPVVNDPTFAGVDATHDPRRSLLSERFPGTLADQVWVPAGSVVRKPAELSFVEAACLPTSWLTAYRMLFVQSGLVPGQTVLVQGAGGGVSTALVLLARQAGFRVWVTSRTSERGDRAVELGAHRAFASGERLPERVDAVMESVGAATWSHSVNALSPGGTIVVCGATSGDNPERTELTKIFFKPLRVVGSTMGTRDELAAVTQMLVATGLRPPVDRVLALADAADGFRVLVEGTQFGKIVLEP